jgi:SAM-dependent methyltransferase
MKPQYTRLPVEPVSSFYGYDRGTPVDRYYIERFLHQHRHLITGNAAEIKDDTYIRRFGRNITATTVIDVDPHNANATLRADLTMPGSLSDGEFDVLIVTHTLQLLHDPAAALDNCWHALVPGGTLLLTTPTVGRLSLSAPDADYWRITPPGLTRLFATWAGEAAITGHGNLPACLAMLLGHAAEELPTDILDRHDAAYPLLACAHARRPE